MKKALVTGANGFIGSLLVNKLIENEVEVIAADLQGHNDKVSSKARFVDFDMHHFEKLKDKITDRDIDVIFHMAWAGSSGDARGDYALQLDNVKCTCNAVEIASQMNIKRFVGAGTIKQMDCLVYASKDGSSPNQIHNYGAAKIATQFMSKAIANERNIEHIWCLFPSVYGVGDTTTNFINITLHKMLSGDVLDFTDGQQNCDFVYITDMIHGLFLCGEYGKANSSYYIGSGKARILKEYIEIMRNAVNLECKIYMGKIPFSGISLPIEMYSCKNISADTGYSPKITFESGIAKTIDWLKQNIKEKNNV